MTAYNIMFMIYGMGQNSSKFILTKDKPLKTFWVVFVPVYVLVMILISIPLYIAGLNLGDFFAVGGIPLAVAAMFSPGFLKD